MTGRKAGLGVKFQNWVNSGENKQRVFAIHCFPHRLHLATNDALKATTYANTFEDINDKLHQFYNRNKKVSDPKSPQPVGLLYTGAYHIT